MTMASPQTLELQRDLKNQLADLSPEDSSGIYFVEWSPGRKMVSLWSMLDGMEIRIPNYMASAALGKKQDGRYMFTANQESAPRFREGNIKCFLAEGSPERTSGLLEEAGLDGFDFCKAVHLRTVASKRVHAENRHKTAWPALKEFLADREKAEQSSQMKQQTDAMLAMAGQEPRRGPGRPRKEATDGSD